MAQPLKKKVESTSNKIEQFLLERQFRHTREIERINQEISKLTKSLNERLEVETKKLAEVNNQIIEKFDLGQEVEQGRRILKIGIEKGQRRPAWKEHCLTLTSEAYIKQVIENTEPGKDRKIVEVI